MDLTYSAEDDTFRAGIRDFLATTLPAGWKGRGALAGAEYDLFITSWRSALIESRLLAPAWPREYGGGGLTVSQQSIVNEEFIRAGAPSNPLPSDSFGLGLLGPTVLLWGTPEQKAHFLPRTISGDYQWAQGYSEPDAGSDLFNLRTKAVLDGDEWVIDGEKVWQTGALNANWIFMLVRTDPTAAKAKGLSFMLAPIDQPGIEVRGIKNMAGLTDFAGFRFIGARTAAENIVGGVNNGAKVALTLLGFERGAGGVAAALSYEIELERLMELARHHGKAADPLVRQRIARCYSKVQIIRYLGLRTLSAGLDGRTPGPESSILKMYGAEYHQEVTELAMDIAGMQATAPSGMPAVATLGADPLGVDATSTQSWATIFMTARPGTIYGGSSQIQRNTIGEQILGLPREPRNPIPVQ
jgi:alkylation response protein AidB-like acyl-CoA dehydrogenase